MKACSSQGGSLRRVLPIRRVFVPRCPRNPPKSCHELASPADAILRAASGVVERRRAPKLNIRLSIKVFAAPIADCIEVREREAQAARSWDGTGTSLLDRVMQHAQRLKVEGWIPESHRAEQ